MTASAPAWLADPTRLLEPEQVSLSATTLLVHVSSAAAYAAAHLPGAVLVEPGELVAGVPPAPGRLPDLGRLTALFGRIGYQPDQDIVVYDDEGGGWAGRFIWTLDVIGHARWAYLDGGIVAWAAAG
ncbi:MAG TPA: thiosulfate sulfurtransferase, partial [Gammaproteobacteria bacterium]|nr:thiosulfate sulfurtransferase [Gammaproteobacteria bacterium]